MTYSRNISQLLELHHDLDDLFLQHQRALLRRDSVTAWQRLEEYETTLLAHISDEEEFLLPLYRERAEIALGGAPEIFSNEHVKIRTYVELFKAEMPKLLKSKDRERDTLWLLDSQTTFKRLLGHHDIRERKFLYPAVDSVTTQEEKDELLRHFRLKPVKRSLVSLSEVKVVVVEDLEPAV